MPSITAGPSSDASPDAALAQRGALVDPLPGAVLPAVIDAVGAAAAMLRAEARRPGGPRGGGESADIDAEVERMLAAQLCPLLPGGAFLGEETGALGDPSARYRWHVDPNDGTAPYLRGARGSAVSVGLCRDGLPVLGVVWAPLDPDDDGDWLAWAEGGPLLRRGAPIAPAPLPTALGGLDVVLVSQHADRAAAANAAAVAPARFRALPSIAWRLALTAAGEAAAATSLAGPWSWDLVGGHALLRAVGGEVVGADGQPLRYPGAAQRFPRAIGGAHPVAAALAARPWDALTAADPVDELTARFPLAAASRDRCVTDPGRLARAQGCLLGQVAGDALGQLVEFRDAAGIAAQYPEGVRALHDGGAFNTLAGQPTDDSELALLLARCLLAEGGLSIPALRSAYVAWMMSDPFDIGGTTGAGLEGRPNRQSQANGALMRVSPLAIFGADLPDAILADLARQEAAITHPHRICGDASAAFCVAIAHALRAGDGPAAAHAAALAWAEGDPSVDPAVVADLRAAAEGPPPEFMHQMGWVRIALRNAFYELLHAPRLEDGLVRTVGRGGDTDTNGAIAGALLGAVHGRDAVPLAWRSAVLSCRALPASRCPRPKALWPVDAPLLAEQLLAAGAAAAPRGGLSA
ncbi:MAG: High confidence in function and specificity [Pseudomonadota bacterium]